jgi:O-antigen/teichoic acid export membrane protein
MTTNQKPGLIRQNVFYSLLDYVSQPAMMILAAPVLLKTLGIQQYGAWMLVNSIAATAGGLGGGFGDGATKFISMYRGRNDNEGVARSLAAALAINCALGFLLAMGLVVCAPLLIGNVFQVEPALRHDGIVAVRISALVLLLRFAQAVFMSAARGYERYRPVVAVTVSSRVLTVVFAVVFTAKGFGLVGILWATLAVEAATLVVLAIIACAILQVRSLPTTVIRAGVREVSAFGAFTWLKSVMGVLFGYADRLIVAALLGTGPLALYVLCNQLTQPIQALLASGFNFLFPNVSARSASGKWIECQSSYRAATLVSVCIVAAICLPMIFAARGVLAVWLGPGIAERCRGLLIAMTIGNGLLAICVVPHYTALALGRSRSLAYMNLAAGIASLTGVYVLVRHVGLVGGGVGKVFAGLISLSAFAIVRPGFKLS